MKSRQGAEYVICQGKFILKFINKENSGLLI